MWLSRGEEVMLRTDTFVLREGLDGNLEILRRQRALRWPSSSSSLPIAHINESMEEDRAIADLGPELPADLNGEDETATKTPKRRFIGRRAADAKAAAKSQTPGKEDGTIEDSGAVQGATYSYTAWHHNESSSSCLAQLLPAAALPVP